MGGWLEGSCGWWYCGGVLVRGWGGDGVVVYWVGGCVSGVLVRGGGGWSYFKIFIIKIFHFINTHPPIEHIQSITWSLYIYSPTHKQLLCQNISLGTPTHPLNISKVSLCHCTYTHPPTVHILTHPQTVMVSKYFIL